MIPIEPEPKPWDLEGCERCCFCRKRTRYWVLRNGKVDGESVACCPECAKTHEPSDLPSKRQWCMAEREQKHTSFSARVADGTTWVALGEALDNLEWRLRHGSPLTRADGVQAASVVACYRALLLATDKRRRMVARSLVARLVEPQP